MITRLFSLIYQCRIALLAIMVVLVCSVYALGTPLEHRVHSQVANSLAVDKVLGAEQAKLVAPAERTTTRQQLIRLLLSSLGMLALLLLLMLLQQKVIAPLLQLYGSLGNAVGGSLKAPPPLNQVQKSRSTSSELRKLGNRLLDIARAVDQKLQLATRVLDSTSEGIFITDPEFRVTEVNPAFTELTGFDSEAIKGQPPMIMDTDSANQDRWLEMQQSIQQSGSWRGEIWLRRQGSKDFAAWLSVNALRTKAGHDLGYVGIFTDITQRKLMEEHLAKMAHYDALTKLPNRLLLADRLKQAMSQAGRRNNSLVVAYLDLDGFKAVNDTYGHDIGDQLLIALSRRMNEALRQGDTLARLGGDEFVAVLVDLVDTDHSIPILQRLLEAAASPVHVGELSLQVSSSIGASIWPQPESIDADQLVRQADQAMYQAKQAGRNRYHFFDTSHDRNVRAHHEKLARIRQGLLQGEFVLHYQPKVHMQTGELLGVEALIRWQHPERGLLAPATFLPDIEQHALSIEVGEWVINTALCQIEAWHAAGRCIPVSVNVNALQLQHADFVPRLRQMLASYPGVKPRELELEVVETSSLQNCEHIAGVMRACEAMGVPIAIDDFGTGYSSLAYLKKFPASTLKIDQGFVRDMLDDPDDLAILDGVIGLAVAFRRQVIAEGVETPEHGAMLLRLGCLWGQGYAIARPMPAHDLLQWSRSWKAPQLWQRCKPVSLDRVAVVFAVVEYRAWFNQLIAYLHDDPGALPALEKEQSRFDDRLAHGGRDLLNDMGMADIVDALNQQMHQLARELTELKHQGQATAMKGRLPELFQLRDQLLQQLSRLY